MNNNRNHETEANNTRYSRPNRRAEYSRRVVKTIISALIVIALTSLVGIVIFAFAIKPLTLDEEKSFHLLNSAFTLIGTLLGAVLGYYIGKGSSNN